MHSGKEEFYTEPHELKLQLGECFKKINALRCRNQGAWATSWIALRRALSKRERERKKKLMAEIAELQRDKPEVSEYNKKEEEMKGFDPCFSKDEWWYVTNINEQMGAVMEEKKGNAAAFDQLMSERWKRYGLYQWAL